MTNKTTQKLCKKKSWIVLSEGTFTVVYSGPHENNAEQK